VTAKLLRLIKFAIEMDRTVPVPQRMLDRLGYSAELLAVTVGAHAFPTHYGCKLVPRTLWDQP
jgi:hypothetical protein